MFKLKISSYVSVPDCPFNECHNAADFARVAKELNDSDVGSEILGLIERNSNGKQQSEDDNTSENNENDQSGYQPRRTSRKRKFATGLPSNG